MLANKLWSICLPDGLTVGQVAFGSDAYPQIVALRSRVLREPLGLAYTPEQLAEESDNLHFAAFIEGALAGCFLLALVADQPGTVKLRQVAVAPDLQGQGVGQRMMRAMEAFAVERGFTRVMMHARETAVPFYEKLGYQRTGTRFFEVTLPHWRMEKRLERPSSQSLSQTSTDE